MEKLKVVHPVHHDGKIYGRGTIVVLSDKDAASLKNLGYVKLLDSDAAVLVPGSPAALESMTKAQLVEYAAKQFKLELNLSFNKAELIAALNEKAATVAEAAAAETKAKEEQA